MKNVNLIIKIPKFRNVGFSYTNFDLGESIRIVEGDTIRFKSTFSAFSATMGGNLLRGMLYGISVRHIWQSGFYDRQRGEVTFTSNSVDVGFLKQNAFSWLTINYMIPFEIFHNLVLPTAKKNTSGMSFGISLSNIGPRMQFLDNDTKFPLPQMLRIGVSHYIINNGALAVRAAYDRHKFIISYDEDSGEANTWYKAIFNSWGEDSPIWIKQYGLEIKLFNVISIRRGFEHDDRVRGEDNSLVNLDSRSIVIGSEGFRLVYTETDLVKRHSVWDAIKDPEVFRDYVPSFQGRLKTFTFSVSF